MKGGKGGGGGGGGTSASLASPAVVVVLVLLIGATFYLWRARYIRRSTAYVTMALLAIALAAIVFWQYQHPMRDLGV
jgi:NADH:ubiquinone oxidoreductase subunit 2 (subunit N)